MKKILITGANGQLGNELRLLNQSDNRYFITYVDIAELDLCDATAVEVFITQGEYDYIVNCAAYTAVDRAETDSPACYSVNRDAVAHIAVAAARVGARVIHISTDYVYSGCHHRPYTEEDAVAPTSVYGASKAAGEEALMRLAPQSVVLRTSWLYSGYGNNFVKTMRRLCSERSQVNVIYDQVGTPTHAADLAAAIMHIVAAETFLPGIYNYANEGVCSWYDFAVSICRIWGITHAAVLPIATEQYPTPAQRPPYSVMSKEKVKKNYGLVIPHWEASLQALRNREK